MVQIGWPDADPTGFPNHRLIVKTLCWLETADLLKCRNWFPVLVLVSVVCVSCDFDPSFKNRS
jgi:hypothetical protein